MAEYPSLNESDWGVSKRFKTEQHNWTDTELQRLVSLDQQGFSIKQIADSMKVTYSQAQYQLKKVRSDPKWGYANTAQRALQAAGHMLRKSNSIDQPQVALALPNAPQPQVESSLPNAPAITIESSDDKESAVSQNSMFRLHEGIHLHRLFTTCDEIWLVFVNCADVDIHLKFISKQVLVIANLRPFEAEDIKRELLGEMKDVEGSISKDIIPAPAQASAQDNQPVPEPAKKKLKVTHAPVEVPDDFVGGYNAAQQKIIPEQYYVIDMPCAIVYNLKFIQRVTTKSFIVYKIPKAETEVTYDSLKGGLL